MFRVMLSQPASKFVIRKEADISLLAAKPDLSWPGSELLAPTLVL